MDLEPHAFDNRDARCPRRSRVLVGPPYVLVKAERFAVDADETEDTRRLEQALRDRVRAAAAGLPDPESLLRMTERMNARQLADASIEAKAQYANEPRLRKRLELALAMFPTS